MSVRAVVSSSKVRLAANIKLSELQAVVVLYSASSSNSARSSSGSASFESQEALTCQKGIINSVLNTPAF